MRLTTKPRTMAICIRLLKIDVRKKKNGKKGTKNPTQTPCNSVEYTPAVAVHSCQSRIALGRMED